MTTSFSLLTIQDTVTSAARLCARIDADKLPHRAITSASMSEIASMAILVGQLDRIAQAAALYTGRYPDLDAQIDLREQLAAAGYLPLPAPAASPDTAQKEPAHGQG